MSKNANPGPGRQRTLLSEPDDDLASYPNNAGDQSKRIGMLNDRLRIMEWEKVG